jgi:hypothetical protein
MMNFYLLANDLLSDWSKLGHLDLTGNSPNAVQEDLKKIFKREDGFKWDLFKFESCE